MTTQPMTSADFHLATLGFRSVFTGIVMQSIRAGRHAQAQRDIGDLLDWNGYTARAARLSKIIGGR